jgi:hypothetical protein
MFGRLMIEQVAQVDPRMDLQTAVATLVKATEDVEIVRWIELPASVPLFLLVPGDRVRSGRLTEKYSGLPTDTHSLEACG